VPARTSRKNLSEIGEPVDKSEWGMAPQTVNAYFNPLNNEIVFPAAILQPPFYDYLADEAVNYGGIGAVIGHEISHAFDDQGAKFDSDGNLINWWVTSVASSALTTASSGTTPKTDAPMILTVSPPNSAFS